MNQKIRNLKAGDRLVCRRDYDGYQFGDVLVISKVLHNYDDHISFHTEFRTSTRCRACAGAQGSCGCISYTHIADPECFLLIVEEKELTPEEIALAQPLLSMDDFLKKGLL